ncbi:hypothetical protein GW17_00022981 [Ensete ventricosum]|nr:hypothetical protein GW17_00022981 [Ensete ventricosum]RZS14986.1 hypothetical protein BHM03_00046754 [Ensete ventricosum]
MLVPSRDLLRQFVDDRLMFTDLQALVRTGATMVVVSGMFPVGCIPVFLAKFRTQDAGAYDPATGCLKWLNEFSQHHNVLLRRQLGRLRQAHPRATIVYADIYGALMSIYASPRRFGEPQIPASHSDELTASFS